MNEFGNDYETTAVGEAIIAPCILCGRTWALACDVEDRCDQCDICRPCRVAESEARRFTYIGRTVKIMRARMSDTRRIAKLDALDAEFADVVAGLGANR